jgi:Rrf2 family protein
MSHVSVGVEYALHSLLFLITVDRQGRQATTKELAEFQDISADFIAKIFTRLQKARLVFSSEGVKGGFRLAKPADEITVWDVVAAVDGDKPIFDCRNIRSKCLMFKGKPPAWATGEVCSIHAIMLEAEATMRKTLKSRSLADISRAVEGKAGHSLGVAFDAWLSEK